MENISASAERVRVSRSRNALSTTGHEPRRQRRTERRTRCLDIGWRHFIKWRHSVNTYETVKETNETITVEWKTVRPHDRNKELQKTEKDQS